MFFKICLFDNDCTSVLVDKVCLAKLLPETLNANQM